MEQWRLCWVGDGGTPKPVAGSLLSGWEDLAERERALGFKERQPILISPLGRVDPRISRIFRRSKFAAKSAGTQETYVPDLRLFFTYLWQRGLNWDEATADDLADWEEWRLRGEGNPRTIEGAKWGRELAALRLFYKMAVDNGYMTVSPVQTRAAVLPDGEVVEVADLAPTDVRSTNVKWLTGHAYRQFRDVGLGGMLPNGLEDPSWRGRNDGRDMAYADVVYSSGMRRREAGTLLTAELPVLGDSRYYSGTVAKATAKRARRMFYVAHAPLRSLETYRLTTRAQAVRRAQQRGKYERIDGIRVIEEVTRQGVVRWSERGGGLREAYLDKLTDRHRLLMFVRGPGGLEPAMVWLTETGMPLRYRGWSKTFERASKRCKTLGLGVWATPHMLRHSMALRVLMALHRALDRRLGLTPAERRHYEETYGTVWSMVKDLLGHVSEETTREIYLEPLRGLQIETLLDDEDNPANEALLAKLAARTGLILDAA
ncbi:site-specific integrase [Streptomyces californicus]|uniref:Site-specific integrase n=1 Tax=Streptomyces californicus TaxID=67351 RepID=A0ABD7CU64_9ACTN|nr:site-specific integrase [Streptomyces californicus]QRV33958.1 site-specific integrase [Streptomyces californicus]QRV50536.1 site-specific integrase [Streptomyces californicus]